MVSAVMESPVSRNYRTETDLESEPQKRHPSESRRAGVTIGQLEKDHSFLLIQIGELKSAIERMKRMGIVEMTVDGVTKMHRGSALVAQFIANVNRSIVDVATQR